MIMGKHVVMVMGNMCSDHGETCSDGHGEHVW